MMVGFCFWLLFLLSLDVGAGEPSKGLVVLHDEGGFPVAGLLGIPTPSPHPPVLPRIDPQSRMAPMFPVRTPELSPGPVEPQRIEKRPFFVSPFFLVGDDPLSWQWLERHFERLRERKAVGLLVNVESRERWQAMQERFALPLSPLSAAGLAKALSLSHYPVLVTPDGLEQ